MEKNSDDFGHKCLKLRDIPIMSIKISCRFFVSKWINWIISKVQVSGILSIFLALVEMKPPRFSVIHFHFRTMCNKKNIFFQTSVIYWLYSSNKIRKTQNDAL